MIGNCKLYDSETTLRKSHIYPKFAVDYLKATGSKYLRTFAKPDLRMQDGIKRHLLGERAEQEFSKREKWFAEQIFIPYMKDGKKSFDYDENLYYFISSFLWRVLAIQLEHPNVKDKPVMHVLQDAFLEWKLFLRDGIYPRNFDRFYLMFTDRVLSHNLDIDGVDYYTSRALDFTIVTNDSLEFVAVYGKFLRFIFWGILRGGNEEHLAELKVHPVKGRINVPQQTQDSSTLSFLIKRMELVAQMPQVSDQQHEKIVKTIENDHEDFWESDAGRSILNDYQNLDKTTDSKIG